VISGRSVAGKAIEMKCDCEEKWIFSFYQHSFAGFLIASGSLLVCMCFTAAGFLVSILSWNFVRGIWIWVTGLTIMGLSWLVAEVLDRRAAKLQHGPRAERRRREREERRREKRKK